MSSTVKCQQMRYRSWPIVAIGLAGCGLAVQAAAQSADGWTGRVAEIRSNIGFDTLEPRFGAEHSTVDLSPEANLAQATRTGREVSAVGLRWWATRGPSAFGFGIGTVGYLAPDPEQATGTSRKLVGAVPNLSLGWRYRVSHATSVYADTSGARGLIEPGLPAYNTRVGVEWKPARERFGWDRGSFGVQFDSGYRMSLRVRHGGLGVFVRGSF